MYVRESPTQPTPFSYAQLPQPSKDTCRRRSKFKWITDDGMDTPAEVSVSRTRLSGKTSEETANVGFDSDPEDAAEDDHDHWLLHPSDIIVWNGEFKIDVGKHAFQN